MKFFSVSSMDPPIEYHLALQEHAHKQDIKSILSFPKLDGGVMHATNVAFYVLTASRDKTVKLWQICETSSHLNSFKDDITSSTQNPLYSTLIKTFTFHQHFVNCLAYLFPCSLYNQGLILSAGSDKLVYVYSPGLPTIHHENLPSSPSDSSDGPLYTLIGHEANIVDMTLVLSGHISSNPVEIYDPDQILLYTASWDCTIRVWKGWQCVATWKDHQQAVWAVLALDNGTIASGSADKTIRLWKPFDGNEDTVHGSCVKILTIHTDAVRKLCKLPISGFASVGNDSLVVLWSDEGESLRIFKGEDDSYLYTLEVLPNFRIVTAGESNFMSIWQTTSSKRIFKKSEDDIQLSEKETKRHPNLLQKLSSLPSSIWSVAAVQVTQDIDNQSYTDAAGKTTDFSSCFLAGGSDGYLRLFTDNPSLIMNNLNLKIYEAQVASHEKEKTGSGAQVENYNNNESDKNISLPAEYANLPGPEYLNDKVGSKEGQVQLIREASGKIAAYQWFVNDPNWQLVGYMTTDPREKEQPKTQSVSSPNSNLSEKFDYSFPVDIADGAPPLMLSWNQTDNPYNIAESFVATNNLPHLYQNQIVQFILDNTRQISVNPPSSTHHAQSNASSEQQQSSSYHCVTAANIPGILSKLKDFSSERTEQRSAWPQSIFSVISIGLEKSKDSSYRIPLTDQKLLFDAISLAFSSWPLDTLYPVLDCLRLYLLLSPMEIFPSPKLVIFLQTLQKRFSEIQAGSLSSAPLQASDASRLVKCLLRVIINLFNSETKVILDHTSLIVDLALTAKKFPSSSVVSPDIPCHSNLALDEFSMFLSNFVQLSDTEPDLLIFINQLSN